MVIFLALLGGLLLLCVIVYIFQRAYRISSLARSLQLVIRLAWGDNKITEADEQDKAAIDVIRKIASGLDDKKQFAIFMAAVESLPSDIIKSKATRQAVMAEFKHHFVSRWQ